MTGRLDGRVALITGSDSGIGQATAAEFAKEGADVVVHYLHDEEGAQTISKGVEAQGRRAVVVRADIRQEDEVASMFDEATAAFGSLDILMNNAGVDASGKKVAELPTEVFDNAIRTTSTARSSAAVGSFSCAPWPEERARSSTSRPCTRTCPTPAVPTTTVPRERCAC